MQLKCTLSVKEFEFLYDESCHKTTLKKAGFFDCYMMAFVQTIAKRSNQWVFIFMGQKRYRLAYKQHIMG